MSKNHNNLDKKNLLKDASILFIITLVAGFVLGFVYELTKEPIRVQQENAIQVACKEVFPVANTFEIYDYSIETDVKNELLSDGIKVGTIYKALNENKELLGYVLESTSSEGYGGHLSVYLVIDRKSVV